MSTEKKTSYTLQELIKDLSIDDININNKQYNNIRQGDKYTMSDVGVLYYDKKEYVKAMRWYKLAADDDMPTTSANIAQLYELGLGVPVDYLQALKWYLKAAVLADTYVFYSIAGLFERGLGVPVDKEKAVEWYFKYNPDGDYIKRYEIEGNIVTDNIKEKPLGRMIKEAEMILKEETERRKKQKEKEEVEYHRIIHVANPAQDKLEQDIQKSRKKIYILERDYYDVLDQVDDLKRAMTELKDSARRKEERALEDSMSLKKRCCDEIKLLKEMVLELQYESKQTSTRLKNIENDNRALRTATFSNTRKKTKIDSWENEEVKSENKPVDVTMMTCDDN